MWQCQQTQCQAVFTAALLSISSCGLGLELPWKPLGPDPQEEGRLVVGPGDHGSGEDLQQEVCGLSGVSTGHSGGSIGNISNVSHQFQQPLHPFLNSCVGPSGEAALVEGVKEQPTNGVTGASTQDTADDVIEGQQRDSSTGGQISQNEAGLLPWSLCNSCNSVDVRVRHLRQTLSEAHIHTHGVAIMSAQEVSLHTWI